MKHLRIKEDPEVIYLSPTPVFGFWLDVILFILVCFLSAWSLFLVFI